MLRIVVLLAFCSALSLWGTTFTYTTLPVVAKQSYYAETGNINDQGVVVGGYLLGFEYATGGAFVYQNGHTTEVDLFPFAVMFNSINNSGKIVGDYSTEEGWAAFIYQSRTFTYLQFPGSVSNATYVDSINNDGTILGSSSFSTGYPRQTIHFLLADGKYIRIPDIPGVDYYGLNDDDDLVGGYVNSAYTRQAVLFRDGQLKVLPVPTGDPDAYATGINDRGDIVGIAATASRVSGFFLHNGQYSFLNFPGAAFTYVTGINNEDQIVGDYILPNAPYSQTRAFVATPVFTSTPEPSTLLLAGGGFLVCGLAVAIRKSRHPVG